MTEEEELFQFPDLEELPNSVKLLFFMGAIFAMISPNMTPIEMAGALIVIFAIFIPLFLADLKKVKNFKRLYT